MEQNRTHKNKPLCIWSGDLGPGYQEHIMRETYCKNNGVDKTGDPHVRNEIIILLYPSHKIHVNRLHI